jgi:hypothetical protein
MLDSLSHLVECILGMLDSLSHLVECILGMLDSLSLLVECILGMLDSLSLLVDCILGMLDSLSLLVECILGMLNSLSLLVEFILGMLDSLSCSFTSIFFVTNLLSDFVFRAACDCCLTPIQQFFSYIMTRIFNEIMMRSAKKLYKTNTPYWIFIVLAHWNNKPRVDMSLHSDTLFWIRTNQSLLFLLNAACLAEKQHILIL